MASAWVHLKLVGVILISPFMLPMLFVCGICYDLYRSELPPGLGQPLKLRVLHSLVVTAFILVSLLCLKGGGFHFYF